MNLYSRLKQSVWYSLTLSVSSYSLTQSVNNGCNLFLHIIVERVYQFKRIIQKILKFCAVLKLEAVMLSDYGPVYLLTYKHSSSYYGEQFSS